jgi:HSP20 family protein
MARKTGKAAGEQQKDIQKTAPARALTPWEEMERLFGSFLPRHRLRHSDWEWPSWADVPSLVDVKMPKLDIIERDNEVVVRAELAGVDRKDIDVSVTDNAVTIKGSTKKESREEKGDYVRSEISEGSFSRTAALPCSVDGQKAKASFSDGMLELTLPKLEPSRRHSVKVE